MSLPSDIVDAVYKEIVVYCRCAQEGGEVNIEIENRPRLEQSIEEMIVIEETAEELEGTVGLDNH